MDIWYSASEVIKESGLPDSTARRYLNAFQEHFRTQPKRKPRRYDATAPKIIKRINELYQDGRSTEQIKTILSQEIAVIIDIEPEPQHNTEEPHNTNIIAVIDEMKTVSENISKLLELFAVMIQENKTNREEITELKRKITELEAHRALPPDKQQEVKSEEPKRRSFWQRLFKGE